MFKLYLEKAEELEINVPTSTGSQKKQENSRKTSTSVLLTMPKPLTVGHKIAIRPPYLPPEKSEAGQEETIRTEHGTMDCFQIGKGVHQGLYCHPSYLNFMQSTS